MRRRRIAAITAAGALAAAGTGVAVAATQSDDPKEREQAVLADAAKRLDVSPSELRDALAEAQDAQLDADVKAGRLTQEQADAIKERRAQSGTVLGPGGPHLHGGLRLHGGPHELMEAAADALGLDEDELIERLRDGDTLSEIAKAEGKDFADVKAAVRAAMKARLDEAVKDGPLTQEQADQMLDRMIEHLDEFGRFDGPRGLDRPKGPPFP